MENSKSDNLFTEQGSNKTNQKKSFETLPNGNYIGRVYIQIGTVTTQSSINYGRPKYEIQLTVTSGEQAGKSIYRHYVILPANLTQPKSIAEADKWVAAIKTTLDEGDTLLRKCGVEIPANPLDLMNAIARNNHQRRIVNFDVRDGNPYVNHVVSQEFVEDGSESLFQSPGENEMPIK